MWIKLFIQLCILALCHVYAHDAAPEEISHHVSSAPDPNSNSIRIQRTKSLNIHVLTVPMYGHYKTIKELATGLSLRGHHVSFLLCEQSRTHYSRDGLQEDYNIQFISAGACEIYDHRESMMADLIRHRDDLKVVGRMLDSMRELSDQMCQTLISYYKLNNDSLPDIIVYDGDSWCGADLSAKFEIPRVARVGTGLRDVYSATLDTPPHGSGESIQTMYHTIGRVKTFFMNTLSQLFVVPLISNNFIYKNRELYDMDTSMIDTTLTFEGWPALYNTHWGLEYARLLSPNEFLIGHTNNFTADAMLSLDTALEEWLSQSDVPVVYVAFGTMSAGLSDLLIKLVKAMMINENYRFVWSMPPRHQEEILQELNKNTDPRYPLSSISNVARSGETPSSLNGSIWLIDWAPQVAILMHPKVNAFFTHGGMNSVAEATFTQVPLMCMGLFNDQFDNCRHVEDHGFGVSVSRTAILANSTFEISQFLATSLNSLIGIPRVNHALNVAWLYNDAAGGISKAISIIEATAKLGYTDGNTKYIRVWHQLPFWQKYSIDIVVLLFTLLFILIVLFRFVCWIVYHTCRNCIYRCCCTPPRKFKHE